MPALLFLIFKSNYSGEIASTGQTPAHAPQSMQEPASIVKISPPFEIAETGHSPSQVPQEMQSVLIL